MSHKLQIVIKILVAATFFVPLIVLPSNYIFPFIVPKIVWFRSLIFLMLGVYVILLAANWQEYRPRLTLLNITIALFFFSFSISTFVGVDWYRSFWDNHERMLGLFTIFHFILYYYILTSFIKEEKDWRWLLRLFLGAGSIVMMIGVFQKLNPSFLLNNGSDRVSATLGNPIYFSGYGLFLFFVGLLLFLKESSRFWKYYALIGGILGFWGIFGGGTRGTLLGLVAGLAVLLFSYFITLKEYKKIRWTIGVIMAAGLVLLAGLFFFRQTDFVRNIPAAGRLLNTSVSKESANTRIMAWGIALEAWKNKPIFGWGPNNYYYAFNEYYRPEFLEHGWGETWFDNAHNIIVNTLAVQGAVGIIIYLGMFGAAIFVLWRGYRKRRVDRHMVSIGSAFLVAHLIGNVFVFENPTSYLYFFFFLGFVNQISDIRDPAANNKNKVRSLSSGLVIAMAIIVLSLIYLTNINPARANMATLEAIRNVYSDSALGTRMYSVLASNTSPASPHIDDIRNDFARSATQALTQLIEQKKIQSAESLFDVVYNELKKNRELHPRDIRVHIEQAQLAMMGAEIKQDVGLLYEAESILSDALRQSPKRQQVQYFLASLKLRLGKTDEAIRLLRDAITNDYKIAESWWRLVLTYEQMGNHDTALSVVSEADKQGITFVGQGKAVIETIINSSSTRR